MASRSARWACFEQGGAAANADAPYLLRCGSRSGLWLWLGGGQAYTYSGLALLRPELISHYPQRRERFGLKEVFDWAIAQNRLTGEVHQGHWLDVGTPERLDQLRMHLR